VPLEVNFGGDLHIAQLASGEGVLDDVYRQNPQVFDYPLSRRGLGCGALAPVAAARVGMGRKPFRDSPGRG
jgi:hypothetical protein